MEGGSAGRQPAAPSWQPSPEGRILSPTLAGRSSISQPTVRSGLRIGIDGTCLGLQRGYGRFLRELLGPLLESDRTNEYVLFVDRHSARTIPRLSARVVEPPTSASQLETASARGNRGLADVWTMGRAVARERLDVMYFPSVFSWFPVFGRVRVAVAFHDTIAERHARIVFPTLRTRWLWKLKVAWARRQADGLLTVSEWSRQQLASWFGVAPERIYVTPEAPAPAFVPVDDPEPRRSWLRERNLREDLRYLIYVGGFNPHKNLRSLIRAFARLRGTEPGRDVALILVGDHRGDLFHSEVRALRELIGELGIAGDVHFAGFVPDEELRHLFAGAMALVLPSLEEGFGLPAVEAAACGTACVATRNSPLPQLLEGGGLFVDPESPEELAGALERMAAEPARREEWARTALERAGRLSWRVTAEATRRALEAIAAGSRPGEGRR